MCNIRGSDPRSTETFDIKIIWPVDKNRATNHNYHSVEKTLSIILECLVLKIRKKSNAGFQLISFEQNFL